MQAEKNHVVDSNTKI